jgi:uncharacterized membrane protein
MIPARYAPVLFGLILSGFMSFIVSGIATLRAAGLNGDLLGLWFGAWIFSRIVAFPTVLVVAPVARGIVARLTAAGEKPGTGAG